MGSEIPVDSITIESNLLLLASLFTSLTRSSLKVQQMHPLLSSTSFYSVFLTEWWFSLMKLASMFTSDISFTITAILLPSLLCRMWLRSVVFPDPKNPDNTVTESLLNFLPFDLPFGLNEHYYMSHPNYLSSLLSPSVIHDFLFPHSLSFTLSISHTLCCTHSHTHTHSQCLSLTQVLSPSDFSSNTDSD
jgi:hypothetical protein